MQRDYVYRFFPIVLVDFHSHRNVAWIFNVKRWQQRQRIKWNAEEGNEMERWSDNKKNGIKDLDS